MSQNYHSLIDEFKCRLQKDLIFEATSENDDLVELPYPYVTPGKEKHNAMYYWDTFFINTALLKMNLVDQARHNVENLLVLYRKYGYIPFSNQKSKISHSSIPMLPWIVRDIYRATGDKEWLRRYIDDVTAEYNFWTSSPHTTPAGLYRYFAEKTSEWTPEKATVAESGWTGSSRFDDARNYNPIDLNAILYRNAKIIYDLQIEASGSGDKKLLDKSEQIQKLSDTFWNKSELFYFDNNYMDKKLSNIKCLAGFMPLFVEMVPENRAADIQQKLAEFVAPGGLYTLLNGTTNSSAWDQPHTTAPYMYFVVKGLCDYDFMEDAADIGSNWLDMVMEQYEKTGELWEWYNVEGRSIKSPNGLPNSPIMGWTMGTYIALLDSLGL